MELSNKRVMVVGLGVSGLAAARFLASRGAKLVMTDRRVDIERGKLPPGAVKLGAEDASWVDGIDLVVTSPGVPRDSILLRAATERKIPVIGEIELASRFLDAPIAAVTGTNGKSTVVVLLGEILKASGRRTFVGGNLGTPLIDAVDGKWDVAVVEVSSFQLEWIEKFRPKAGVHLNLSDDHFDRYKDLADYGNAKARLFENQDASDYAILNRDDPNVWKLAKRVRSRVIGFGHARGDSGASIWFDERANALVFDFDDTQRAGASASKNFVCAGGTTFPMRWRRRRRRSRLASKLNKSSARSLRFADCRIGSKSSMSSGGVTYIDDSKGTNVGAVVEAIDALAAPIILIAGGLDKGGDYAPLRRPLEEKVKLAILNGAARDKMAAALDGATKIETVATLKEAVEHAARAARSGRHRAAVAGVFELRSIQGLCGTWERI